MTVTSILGQWVQGARVGKVSQDQARDADRHGSAALSSQAQMARWSDRMTRQPELATAREIAGLSDPELAGLSTAFALSPRRQRTDRMRFATPLGVLVFAAGLAGLMLQEASLGAAGRGVLSAFEVICLGSLLFGLVAVSLGTMKAFSLTSVDLAYGHLGQYASVLDEEHPWLYKTLLLMRNGAAQDYRARVLQQRGVLRGIDYVLMREIARADEERVMTLTARDVAAQVQALPQATRSFRGDTGTEPHLVLVDASVSASA